LNALKGRQGVAGRLVAEVVGRWLTAPPGFIATRPDYEQQYNNWSPEFRERFANNIVMRRVGVPTDIADAATFLASGYASRTTAQTIAVTGNPMG
jgi:NAD(P)-dependent dehydrogenase (short-subunit alcohol dehydrogenase family)